MNGDAECVELLLEHGADVDVKDRVRSARAAVVRDGLGGGAAHACAAAARVAAAARKDPARLCN